jgi:hypothetical protein
MTIPPERRIGNLLLAKRTDGQHGSAANTPENIDKSATGTNARH